MHGVTRTKAETCMCSGEVSSDDPLVSFLYLLMRDHVPLGVVAGLIDVSCGAMLSQFTNGWLAEYARDCVSRLRGGP
jgi:hypothetical protein